MSQDTTIQRGQATTTSPTGNQAWKIEMPLDGGGTISFSGDSNKDILAAYKGMQAVVGATCCGCCKSHNTRLGQRQITSTNGSFTQYFMVCDSCGAGYSLSTNKDHKSLLTDSVDKQYQGWIPRQNNNGNGNNSGGNNQSNRQQGNNQQRQQQQQRNNSQQPPRNQQSQQQHDENYDYGGYEGGLDLSDIPF
jgi:hypothetical protein